MEDFKIIDLYWQRDERAISQTAEKYEVYLKSISYNLLHVAEDVQECVNDTYLTAWNSIPPKRPAVLKTWLGRVVRNLSLKKWNHDHALKRYNGIDVIFEELSECIPSEDTVEKTVEGIELANAVNRWITGLKKKDRTLFVARYWYGMSIKELAKRSGIRENNLTQLMYRLRSDLKNFLEKEELV